MRFVTYLAEGVEHAGLLDASTIHTFEPGVRILDLLGDDGERLHEAGEHARANPAALHPVDTVTLLPPIPRPPSIRDFLSFEQHVAGTFLLLDPTYTVPAAFYEHPFFYFTNPYAAVGANADVPMAPGSSLFDFELEVSAILGRAGRNLAPEQASSHIVGYTIMNDWSARDLQAREGVMPLGPAKGKDTAMTLGPCLVTVDELEPHRAGTSFDLEMTVRLNDRVIGTDRLSSMYWSFEEMIAYASRGTWVGAGDHLGSGTCGMGCLAEGWGRHGFEFSPPLAPGDVVEMSVDVLGTIRNTVCAAEPVPSLSPKRRAR